MKWNQEDHLTGWTKSQVDKKQDSESNSDLLLPLLTPPLQPVGAAPPDPNPSACCRPQVSDLLLPMCTAGYTPRHCPWAPEPGQVHTPVDRLKRTLPLLTRGYSTPCSHSSPWVSAVPPKLLLIWSPSFTLSAPSAQPSQIFLSVPPVSPSSTAASSVLVLLRQLAVGNLRKVKCRQGTRRGEGRAAPFPAKLGFPPHSSCPERAYMSLAGRFFASTMRMDSELRLAIAGTGRGEPHATRCWAAACSGRRADAGTLPPHVQGSRGQHCTQAGQSAAGGVLPGRGGTAALIGCPGRGTGRGLGRGAGGRPRRPEPRGGLARLAQRTGALGRGTRRANGAEGQDRQGHASLLRGSSA